MIRERLMRNKLGKMRWLDYVATYKTDGIFFLDTKTETFVAIFEGTGDNLLDEDIENGYVDYWYVEVYDNAGWIYNGGGQLLLTEVTRETNPTVDEIIKYVFANADMLEIPAREMPIMDPREGCELAADYFARELRKGKE